ncbi:peptidoglycan-binding protein [Peterkaempfera bronchialis]|uniref:N-acetylmuramoyl-L-alanine amidase n=1 Tax=Peterkaempfera bronchialis TaxID=2126346 RepID=A0A345SWG1_9ACTN|nr:peptidoglycan-binding protein [Peterkaempfera bronchialis]AXI78066.1 N-acetylmuramoyl-L-alanine amidase [Peterkaempfera bronchialis]
MANPLSADALVTALRDEGVTVVEHDGWRTHNRNHKGPWGPVNGVVIHHTVSEGTAHSVAMCHDGYADLPGPLCHGVVAKDGTVHLVGNGRANHAGSGDPDVLQAVIAERDPLPAPVRNTVDGNPHFYGFECVNLGDGKDPWPEAQLEAIARVSAAICRAHGWHAASVIGHKEWTNTKIDPRGFGMAEMRARIAARLAAPAAPAAPAAGAPAAPRYQPYPGAAWFAGQPRSEIVTAVGRRLVAEGCSAYTAGPGPQWTEADRRSYANWQRKLGYRGADADGVPGRASWEALKVPYTP